MLDSAGGTREDRWRGPRGNTPPMAWTGQAGLSRFDQGLDSGCHDVSVIAVWHLGLGNKTAILTIHPW